MAVILISLFTAASVTGQVTVINESTYPWLVAGTYADYLATTFLEPPYFVTTNGTLLLGIGPSGPGANPAPQGNAWLNWTVASRTGDMVDVMVRFRAYGCDYSEQQLSNNGECTPYDFVTTTDINVNLTSNEAYIDGQPQGLVNFWEPPLMNGGTLSFGTAFVGGKPYTVLGNVSAPHSSVYLTGVPEVNDSGVMQSGPFYSYFVDGITFGTGPVSVFGWEHVDAAGASIYYLDPYGAYDYYNGLAYFFSIPDYPINRTVCNTSSGQAVNCQYTSYATALGSYFRSGEDTLGLASTNVPLGLDQAPPVTSTQTAETTTASEASSFYTSPYIVVPILIIIAGGTLGILLRPNRRRGHRGQITQS